MKVRAGIVASWSPASLLPVQYYFRKSSVVLGNCWFCREERSLWRDLCPRRLHGDGACAGQSGEIAGRDGLFEGVEAGGGFGKLFPVGALVGQQGVVDVAEAIASAAKRGLHIRGHRKILKNLMDGHV